MTSRPAIDELLRTLAHLKMSRARLTKFMTAIYETSREKTSYENPTEINHIVRACEPEGRIYKALQAPTTLVQHVKATLSHEADTRYTSQINALVTNAAAALPEYTDQTRTTRTIDYFNEQYKRDRHPPSQAEQQASFDCVLHILWYPDNTFTVEDPAQKVKNKNEYAMIRALLPLARCPTWEEYTEAALKPKGDAGVNRRVTTALTFQPLAGTTSSTKPGKIPPPTAGT